MSCLNQQEFDPCSTDGFQTHSQTFLPYLVTKLESCTTSILGEQEDPSKRDASEGRITGQVFTAGAGMASYMYRS